MLGRPLLDPLVAGIAEIDAVEAVGLPLVDGASNRGLELVKREEEAHFVVARRYEVLKQPTFDVTAEVLEECEERLVAAEGLGQRSRLLWIEVITPDSLES